MQLRRLWKVNSSRKYLADFAKRAVASIPDGARVLDAGAGEAPYRSYFVYKRYESTDLCQIDKKYGQLSYVSNLNNIPIRANSYDLIFCSQTLEHVPDPKLVLAEIERVLKPGGRLWLTAPFYYEEHEAPYDYYRYTQYGLRYNVQSAGLHIESIDWLEGYFGTLAYQLKEAAKALPIRPNEIGCGLWGWLIIIPVGFSRLLFAILSLLFTWVDMNTKYTVRGHNKNYALIAVKQQS